MEGTGPQESDTDGEELTAGRATGPRPAALMRARYRRPARARYTWSVTGSSQFTLPP